MKKKDPKCGFTLYDIKNLQYKQPIKCHEHPPPHQKKKKVLMTACTLYYITVCLTSLC